MTTTESALRSPDAPASARELEKRATSVAGRVSGAIRIARTGAAMLMVRVPTTIRSTRAGARDATSALQTLPDSTLRSLAASSIGLGAGFYFAGAPRLVVAAGVAPALIVGAAIVLRPIEPIVAAQADP
ncbi:MAG TPA: hypothetical protein VIV06_07135 [Candidatus Limnocylindrales bacterium]